MEANEVLRGLLTALGVGLLIGIIRERSHGRGVAKAGTRTHALIAVMGVVSWGLGTTPFVATLLIIGALAVAGYLKTADADPGMTGEVAIVLTFILGGLAYERQALAASLGVVIAILLYAKKPLQKLTRQLISEREMQDALMLAAAALVVLPLLPQKPIDPWGVLDLNMVWRIVVLVMTVGMLGYIAQRAVGARLGFPIAGFFSGFVSSTLAVASFGKRAKEASSLVPTSSAAALLANLASLFLLAAVIGTISPVLLRSLALPLFVAALVLGVAGFICIQMDGSQSLAPDPTVSRAFNMTHALSIAIIIGLVMVLSAWLRELLGEQWVLVTTSLVALVELQAAAASITQLEVTGGLDSRTAQLGLLGVLISSAFAKIGLAFFSGGTRYGLYVGAGLLGMIVAVIVAGAFVIKF